MLGLLGVSSNNSSIAPHSIKFATPVRYEKYDMTDTAMGGADRSRYSIDECYACKRLISFSTGAGIPIAFNSSRVNQRV